MKIASSQIAMSSLNEHKEYHNVQASLRQWNDASLKGDRISLSSAGLALSEQLEQWLHEDDILKDQSAQPLIPSSVSETQMTDEELFDPEDLKKIRLLEKMLEKLMGKSFKFSRIGLRELRHAIQHDSARDQPRPMPNPVGIQPGNNITKGPQRVGWGTDFKFHSIDATVEKTTFFAKGNIQVEDGRQIDFSLNLHMSRETYEEFSLQYKAGDALIDPIVLRTSELPLQFSSDTISFDLDVDGKNDAFHVPVDSAGLLFMDRNHNGVADDGSELFGPSSGSGFTELASLDGDHNGWIDENDSAFKDLKLWIRSSDGSNQYLGLIEAGVGALYVESAQTDMTIGSTETVGKLRETGLYLKENGQAMLMHEVDLKI